MDLECFQCQKGEPDVRLLKCPICHRRFCDEHAFSKSGMWFCCRGCADYFFHGEGDD